jgi:hypothetical protein
VSGGLSTHRQPAPPSSIRARKPAACSAADPLRQARLNSPGEGRGRQVRWLLDRRQYRPASRGRTSVFPPGCSDIALTVSLFLFDLLLSSWRVTKMTEEKTARELGLTRRTGT